jgi:hypothetical protein
MMRGIIDSSLRWLMGRIVGLPVYLDIMRTELAALHLPEAPINLLELRAERLLSAATLAELLAD